ncbi:MAG: helix-turn-helix transcriptional regulator [Cyanobacteria bacterium P01_D01_bin.156]
MVLSTCDRTFHENELLCDSHMAQAVKNFAPTADDLELIFERLLGQFFPFRGFMVSDVNGHLLRSTTKANEFSLFLHKASLGNAFGSLNPQVIEEIPETVETLCNLLRESCKDYPEYSLQLYDTAFLPGGIRLYLNAEWIDLIDQPEKCILVTIEDLTQVSHHRAMSDAYRYGLTPRETAVWQLYLQGLSYRQVSAELFISFNTVKKHIKNIFSKCNIACRCRHLA